MSFLRSLVSMLGLLTMFMSGMCTVGFLPSFFKGGSFSLNNFLFITMPGIVFFAIGLLVWWLAGGKKKRLIGPDR